MSFCAFLQKFFVELELVPLFMIILLMKILIIIQTNLMKLISIFRTWIFFFGLISLLNAQVSFTVASSTVSPNTARSTSSTYTIQLNAITTFNTNFDVSVTFHPAFSLTGLTGCQVSINNVVRSTTCNLMSASNLVSFSSIGNSATINNMTLVFVTNTALYAGSFIASLSYYLPGTPTTTYGSNFAPLTITNTNMAGCSFTSNTSVVGAPANFQLTYSPSSTISAGSILQVQLAPWSAYNLSNFILLTPSTVCGGACTIRSPNQAQGFFNQILTYSSLYSTNSTSNMTLTINNARNPASTQPVTITVTLFFFINSTSQPSYMTCSTTFAPTTPNQFSGISFSPSTQTISETNPITLVLNVTNPISSISYLRMTYPNDISISFTYVASNQASVPVSYPITGGLLLGSLTTSTTIFPTLFLVQFFFTNAPYGNFPVSVVFQTYNQPSGSNSTFLIDTTTLSYTFTPSTIFSAVVTALNTSIGVTTNITLAFTTINTLILNSKIIVTLPTEITSTNSSSCIANVSSTCTVLNSTSFFVNINVAAILKGSTISITINNVVNPATTTPTSSFSLTTYYYNTSTPTDIMSSGASFTATPVNLASGSITPTSLTVAASTIYTITFQNTNPLPSGSYVIVTFPSQFSNAVGAALTSFTISGTVVSGCTMSILSTLQFQFNSCITSNAPSLSTFSIRLSNIINPSSTKPTNSLTIQTYFNNLLMQSMSNGLVVTLTTQAALLSASVSSLNPNVNSITTYTFSLSFSQQYTSGSRIIVTFPSLITYNPGFSCSSSTSGVSVSCIQSTATVLLVIMNGAGTLPSSITWTVTNVQNAWYGLTSTFNFDTTTSDTTYYYMQRGSASITMQPISLNVAYTPNNQLTLFSASTLNINIVNTFTVNPANPSLLKLDITLPSQLTLTTTTCITSISGALCASGSGNTITITQMANFSNTINVTFSTLASYFTTTSAFNIVLSYNGFNVASNSVFTVSSYCISPCQGCNTNASQCTSCLPSTYTTFVNYFSLNNSCLANCPATYFVAVNSTICQACNSSACLNCVTTANTCTSCSNPLFLSGNTCLAVCPNTFYGINNTCVNCINNCFNCTSATICISCVTPFNLNPDKSCLATCPSGYAPVNSVCTLCTNNCLTCSSSPSTCTSCSSPYFLSGTACVLTCPNTFYGNSNNSMCVNCINQCFNCTNATYCLSCVNGFSLNPDYTCRTTCPSGYTSVSSLCTLCTNNCLTCSGSPSTCTSCANPFFLSGSTCTQICPNTFFGNNNLCVVCINQCFNCTNATYCLSCITSFSLNPDNTCRTTCPSGYVSVNSVCSTCTSNCFTCSNTRSNCTSCASPYFLTNNNCVQTCPNTFYGNNTLCVSCVNQCFNCTNSTYCLSCVSGYSLNPDNTCKLTCPSGYVSVSSLCNACTQNCRTCSVSTSNCTSCGTGFILHNNSCILACPLGKYLNSNNQCQNCISPCNFCLTATLCTSCVANFYFYNESQCVSSCPAGTFIYISVCQNCSSSCQTCFNTATNCTSCYANTYFYLNTCYTECPSPTYPYQGRCTTCVQPCATCLNSALLCSSCIDGYLLLNATCVLSCPSIGYVQLNGSCLNCPTNCVSCKSSIVCSTCNSGYYLYQGGCVTSCPSTSPIIVSQTCNSCSAECATCSGSPDNCITCTLFYFKYSYTCVQTCPISYYSNIMSYTCESGLSSKIVFFPVLITYVIIVGVAIIFKVYNHSTSFPTVVASLSGWMQIIISAYLLSLLSQTYLQIGINYALPQALIAISFVFTAATNILHFKINYQRLAQDEYVRKWQNINVNYTYFVIFRYLSLFTHCKIFRMIYSKLFGSIHLSLIANHFRNVFTISTVVTVIFLFLTQVPLLIATFYLSYNKLLKDQIFYTSVECLLVVIFSIIISLIDIHKPDNYFEDTEFMMTKRYLQKVNNNSLNKLEDEYREKDEGSLDGQKLVGTSGGKFVFTRRDPNSMNENLLEEGSAATDAYQTLTKPNKKLLFQQQKSNNQDPFKSELSPKSIKSKTSSRLEKYAKSQINIFEPIQQEQAEYYEFLKYDEQDFKTAAKIEKQNAENQSQQEGQLQLQRKQEFGTHKRGIDNSDNRSMLEYRQRRQQWNNIIEHRQKLANQIFNTVETKQLYKQLEKIEQPINEDDYDFQQNESERKAKIQQRRIAAISQARDLPIQQANVQRLKQKRRRRKKGKRGNKQLQEIYLQRLAQKVDPKKKAIYASSNSYKYEF